MVESNVTRRRVLQGAGAIGVASLGSTVISAQEGGGAGDQGAAIRVAHLSPDAPNVDVRLTSQDGGVAAGAGNETAGNDTGLGGENETNETAGGAGDGETEIGGLGFRDVSSYNEVDPGTYQVEIVPASGGIQGFIEDIFGGGGEDEETVLFDGEVEVEEGTTYTVVAFGEVARGPIPAEDAGMETAAAGNETDGVGDTETGGGANETGGVGLNETGGNETGGAGMNETDGTGAGGTPAGGEALVEELAFGQSQTLELDAGDYSLQIEETSAGGAEDALGGAEDDSVGVDETDGTETDGIGADTEPGQEPAGEAGGSDRGFQVQVLEDDVSDPGDGTARVRIFHAVPDVGAVSISQISDGGTPAGGGAGGDDGTVAGTEADAGNETEEIGGTGAGENETEAVGADGAAPEAGVRRVSLSIDGNTVYSAFATGYFDTQAAASAGDQDAGNETGGENDTVGENVTGVGNETANATAGGDDEQVAEDASDAAFELVTVETAQGGERADGGTGGLLDLAPPADD